MMKRLILILMSALLLCSCSNRVKSDVPDATTTESKVTDSPVSIEETHKSSEETVLREPSTQLVIDAYKSGDGNMLNSKEKELLEIAEKVIGEIITDDMSEADKCVAIHDYIVTHGTYDKGELAVIKSTKEYSHLAYGFLTEGEGICSGFTDSFRMFAEMLGIENLVVEGEAVGEAHRWNMVKIDGEWYHIDCTWDDFVPDNNKRPAFHIYTFVTDEALSVNHKWDKDKYPDAVSTKLNYYKNHGLWADTAEEAIVIVSQVMANSVYAEVAVPLPVEAIKIEVRTSYWYTVFDSYYVLVFQA